MKLNNYKVYKAYWWEELLANILPYYLPFINKRRRVRIRRKYRNKWKNRFMIDMTNVLKEAYSNKKPNFLTVNPDWFEADYSWEIINEKIKGMEYYE